MKNVELVSGVKIIKEEYPLEDVLKSENLDITFSAFKYVNGKNYVGIYQLVDVNLGELDVFVDGYPVNTIGFMPLLDSTLIIKCEQDKLREYALSHIDMFMKKIEE